MINTTTRPCRNGHRGERLPDGKCRECVAERSAIRHAMRMETDPQYVEMRRAAQESWKTDPAKRARALELHRARRADPFKRARERELEEIRRAHPQVKQRISEQTSANRKKPERAIRLRRNWLRKTYNITPDDYAALLDAQGGHCALCPATRHSVKCGRPLGIDHDHGSSHIRGLLCHACNVTLGHQGDTLEVFMRSPFCTPIAMQYLIGPADRSFSGLVAWYRAGGPRQPRRLSLVHGEMAYAA